MPDECWTEEKIKEQLALCEAASPLPWSGDDTSGCASIRDSSGREVCWLEGRAFSSELDGLDQDGQTIVCARNNYPSALREIRTLMQVIRQLDSDKAGLEAEVQKLTIRIVDSIDKELGVCNA